MNKFYLLSLLCLLSLLLNEIDGAVLRKKSKKIEKKLAKVEKKSSIAKSQSFSYEIYEGDLSMDRQETHHSNGTITGSYLIWHPDFTRRKVSYWADDTGFHVNIESDEKGVKPINTADATFKTIKQNKGGTKQEFGGSRPITGISKKDVSTGSINKDDPEDYSDA